MLQGRSKSLKHYDLQSSSDVVVAVVVAVVVVAVVAQLQKKP